MGDLYGNCEHRDLDQEINPWEAQRARFDFAARKLNLDPGLWRVLRSPVARDYCAFSGQHGRRPD